MNIALRAIDFAAISPLFILLGGALLLLLLESFAKEETSKKFAFFLTLVTLIGALIAAFYAPTSESPLLTSWLRFDSLARFFNLLFLTIGIGSTLLSISFFQRFDASQGEYYFFLLSSLFGLLLIGASADFLTLFLGLETLSIPLYILCGYMKKWEMSHESAIKYFLIGALATALFLYGIALIYGAVGTTHLEGLLEAYRSLTATSGKVLFLGGIALVTLGLAFKAAIVPFHTWAPDVYEGAPTPVTAFMAVGTKAGAFAAFVRVFLEALPQFDPLWSQGAALLAYSTLIYANIVALRQIQLRRFFAYSGIAHAGFLLIPLIVGTPNALSALMFYLVVYTLATLGCFAVLALLDQRSQGTMMRDLYGLYQRSPLIASFFALCLLTLAGIPPTAGFFAKFYIFKVAFQAGYNGLVIVGLLMTIFSVFYYLRIVTVMFSELPTPTQATLPKHSWSAITVGLICFAAIVFLSCYPTPLLNLLGMPQLSKGF